MPGILAGMLLVFALASSSYVVAALMGGWKVWVLPVHIFQQISNGGHWQFGACIATILFVVNIAAVFIYQAVASRVAGGRA
jgi:putative spermidine/putrescine transport system permease protein